MPITHQQIAEKLGVSRTLVTGALHGTRGAGINSETQELVLQTAREMGYVPRNRTTHTIGLIVQSSHLSTESMGVFLREIEAALQHRGYRMALMTIRDEALDTLRDAISPKNVDGVIITESFGNRVTDLLPPGMPAVLTYDADDIDPSFDVVAMDVTATLTKLTRLLLDQGHKQFALLTVPSPTTFYRRMEQGVRRELARAGVAQENLRILELDDGPQGTVAPVGFASNLIEGIRRSPAATALIATDLWRAMPAAQVLSAAGIRIPGDVSLVSLYESQYFKAMTPPLTATTVYSGELASRVVERLVEKIESPEIPATHELVVGEIVERGSVGPPPASNMTCS